MPTEIVHKCFGQIFQEESCRLELWLLWNCLGLWTWCEDSGKGLKKGFVEQWLLQTDRCLKSGSIPSSWGWSDLSQASSSLIYASTPLCSAKYISPSPTILPQPASFFSSSASLSFFDLQHQNLMPISRHDHPLSSAHDHANEHCFP